jgi:hypothetical protein
VICMLERERRLELVNFDQMTSKFVWGKAIVSGGL